MNQDNFLLIVRLYVYSLRVVLLSCLMCCVQFSFAQANELVFPTPHKARILAPVSQGVLPLTKDSQNILAKVISEKGKTDGKYRVFIEFTIPLADYAFLNAYNMDQDIFVLTGKRRHNFKITKRPLEASLPFIVRKISAPKGKVCVGVKMLSSEYSTFPKGIMLAPLNQFSLHGTYQEKGSSKMLLLSKEYYKRNEYQPGTFIDFFSTRSPKSFDYVTYLRFFPVQYVPCQGEITVLTKAKIALYYTDLKS